MIATPTAGGVVKTEFANTLVGTIFDLKNRGIDARYMSVDGADVELARNYLSTLFLEDDACTHLFFVDSHVSFSAGLCHRLIEADCDIIGAACPRREMDMGLLAQHVQSGTKDLNTAMALSMTYNVSVGTDQLSVRNGLCQVDGIGTAVMLIKKVVFRTMLEMGVANRKENHDPGKFVGLSGGMGNFFERIRGEEKLISEDLSFCRKWKTQCGGEIWAVVDQDIGHVGSMRYGVPYYHRLAQGFS